MLKNKQERYVIPLLVIPAELDPILNFNKLSRFFDTYWTVYQNPIFRFLGHPLDEIKI
jgi:hypothetical protein